VRAQPHREERVSLVRVGRGRREQLHREGARLQPEERLRAPEVLGGDGVLDERLAGRARAEGLEGGELGVGGLRADEGDARVLAGARHRLEEDLEVGRQLLADGEHVRQPARRALLGGGGRLRCAAAHARRRARHVEAQVVDAQRRRPRGRR
jgi:hypothetical protein